MIKIIVTLVHLTQLAIHSWFMYHSVLAFQGSTLIESLWNQVKYLTNFSNWAMFLFIIPFVIFDFKNFNKDRIKDRYPQFVSLLFQGINPIIFLVMASYQSFLLIDPKLLVIDGFFPTEWQMVLLAYLHLGNWILIQFEYILYEHEKVSKLQLFLFFFFYAIIYLAIYGSYFYQTGKHVYGFQQTMTMTAIIVLNISQFSVLVGLDFLYSKVIHSNFFRKLILENYFIKNQKLVNKKDK